MSEKKIEFLERAKKDLREIAAYTNKEHGPVQREKYLGQIETRINQLKGNPELGRERSEIRAGLRSINADKHVVFYRIKDAKIQILEVRHGSRDLKLKTERQRRMIRNRAKDGGRER